MKKILALIVSLTIYCCTYAGNLAFSFSDIAHVVDVSPPFVSQAGGSVALTFEITSAKELQVGSNLRDVLNGQFYSSGITCTKIRKTGGASDYATYEAFLEIAAIPIEESRREIAFRGIEDYDSQVVVQGVEILPGVVSGIDCDEMIPGQYFDILVTDVEPGIGYTLYRYEATENIPIETKTTRTNTIVFHLSTPGTYAVGNGSSWCEGIVHARTSIIFSEGFFQLNSQEQTVALQADGGIYTGSFIAQDEIPVEVFENYMGLLASEFPHLWSEHLHFGITKISSDRKRIYFKITYGPNISDEPRIGDTQFVLPSGETMQFIQPAGGHLQRYYVTAKTNSGRTALTVRLSGSQPEVTYSLKNQSDITVRSSIGTGKALEFSQVDTAGVYRVEAYCSDMNNSVSVQMIGEAQMPVWLPGFDDDTAQEPGNYVRTYDFRSDSGEDYTIDVSYYNGLGYPTQMLQGYASGDERKHIVTPVRYDNMLNPDRWIYLPYATSVDAPIVQETDPFELQNEYYTQQFGEIEAEAAFIENEFEATSQPRILQSRNAGRIFRERNKSVRHAYGYNTKSEVRNILSTPYPSHALRKHTIENEDGVQTIEFTDLEGKIHVQREIIAEDTTVRDVWYYYDDLNRLWLVSTGYAYNYDSLGRVSERYLHGVGDAFYLYDDEDQMVYKGTKNVHYRYVYDDFGRLKSVYAKHRAWYQYQYGFEPILDSITVDNFGGTLLSAYEYGSSAPHGLRFEPVEEIVSDEDVSEKIRGFKTYEKQLIVRDSSWMSEDNEYVERAYYYDYRGRLVQQVEKTHLGSILRKSYKYDFRGNILAAVESHTSETFADHLRISYQYDSRNRVTREYAVLNGGTPAQVYFTYDDLGRLASKTFPVDGDLVTETYEYDIHGWPTRRRSRYFDQQLIYCDSTENLPVTPRFSGNIAATKWQHEGQPAQAYVYDYDSRGQLTKARTYNAEDDSAGPNRFAEFVQYHPNRVIKSMARYDGYGVCTDSLVFPDNDRPEYLYDCKEGEPRQCTFGYDLTGNMISDEYNYLDITYNFLNLPSNVRGRDFYTYLADGTKCAVIGDYDAGFDYIGSLLYLKTEEDTLLASAAFGSGRIVATSQSSVPHYYLCDHLGSTRAIVTQAGVTETYDYYPYGLTWQQAERPIGTNTYLFTGKEWQAQDGVDLYDFGARFYQPRFGKWLSIDPLAEEYMGISPYAYCGNDPVNRVDPDGQASKKVINNRTNTITILQNLYATGSYYNDAKRSADFWNRQTGLHYTDDTGRTYQVRFKLSVRNVINPHKEAVADDMGNSYQINQIEQNNTTGDSEVFINGFAKRQKYITVDPSRVNTDTGAHEIGHTLHMEHVSEGIMTPTSDDKNRMKPIPQDNVDQAVERADETEIINTRRWKDRLKSLLGL